MKVLAIDPGYDRLGVAVVERIESTEHLCFSSCFTTNKDDSLPERIFALGKKLESVFEQEQPTHVAIETLFFNKNVKTAIAVAQARGAALYLARLHGAVVCEYSPQEVKVAVTGYGKSDKTAVYTMIRQLIRGVPEKGQDDEFDAIAVGITCLAHNSRSG